MGNRFGKVDCRVVVSKILAAVIEHRVLFAVCSSDRRRSAWATFRRFCSGGAGNEGVLEIKGAHGIHLTRTPFPDLLRCWELAAARRSPGRNTQKISQQATRINFTDDP
jgi:hypothetical protein